MVLYVKDVGGYHFSPDLPPPTEPCRICGSIEICNQVCGEYKYALRIYRPWLEPMLLHDNALHVLYIKAVLVYCADNTY